MKLKDNYSEKVIERGEEYEDAVRYCIKINNFIYGNVKGSNIYRTEVDLKSLEGECSCPYEANCKHAVALYLNYKKGKFWDAEDFIKSLNKMSKSKLIEMILSKLQDNPDWIKKHNLKKSVNKKIFVREFKKSFSSGKIEEAEAVLPNLSFGKLLELYDYIDGNYDDLAERLGEESEYYEHGYDYWDDEEYDRELSKLYENLKELIIKKALKNNKAAEVIKRVSLREEIIVNAESFILFKREIKKKFSKDDYLKFLLNIKKPDVLEIKSSFDKSNKRMLYDFIDKKPDLIKSLVKIIKDDTLNFSVAIYEKSLDAIINNFDQFDNAMREDYRMIYRLSNVVDLLMKNKINNEKIAKKLLSRHIGGKYNKKQISYIASQIKDFDFIKKAFSKENLDRDIALLERLMQIDKKRTFNFIRNENEFIKRHWSDAVMIFKLLKNNFDEGLIKEYIEENVGYLRHSSHLKKHLKDEGIMISVKKEGLIVEIK